MKALAGQTAKATEEIAAQIAGMQHATERSIEAIGAIERTIREIGDISAARSPPRSPSRAPPRRKSPAASRPPSKRTAETAEQVERRQRGDRNHRAPCQRRRAGVADDLGAVAARIRDQVDQFFAAAEARPEPVLKLPALERRLDVARQAPRRDQHRVEAHVALRVVGMVGEPGRGGRRDPPLLPRGDRLRPRRRAARAPSPRRRSGACRAARRCRSRRPGTASAAPGCESPWRAARRRRGFPPKGRAGTRPGAPARRRAGWLADLRVIVRLLRERQRALIDLAARHAGGGGDFADGVLHRDARERAADHARRARPPRAAASPAGGAITITISPRVSAPCA